MNKVAFSLLGIDIMWYGILIAIGMVIALYIDMYESERVGLDKDTIIDLAFYIIPLGIVGARIYYVLFSWDQYAANPITAFDIRGGGLAIHGGILAGIITGYVFSRVKKIDFFKLSDVVILGVPLAQSIGRWGNYINKEAHGGPTNLPWGVMVDGQKVHPTFLYESVWNLIVFIILFRTRKNNKYEGQLLVEYMMLYSLGRFFIEGLRTDSLMFGPIRMAQFISMLGIIIGIILHFILKNREIVKNG